MQKNLDLLNLRGDIVLITAPVSNKFEFNVREFYIFQKQIKGFVISHATKQQLHEAGKILNKAFKKEMLLNDDIKVMSFDDACIAHSLVEKGKCPRIVLVPKANAKS